MIVYSLILVVICVCHTEAIEYYESGVVSMTAPVTINSIYKYKTLYYKQRVDHFGFTNNDFYLQRYLLNGEHWSPGSVIFFYTGNEGDIVTFCENTGFMWDIAPQFSAMVVFAEHRYYGKSLPYGKSSFKDTEHTEYFTSEQALADYVTLINYLKASIPGARNSPVVAFGGSYGGMLAAWLRMKYPGTIVGAIAASAPIWMFPGMNPCEAFNRKVTASFEDVSLNCVKNIQKSWVVFDEMAKTEKGLKLISKMFHLCKPLKDANDMSLLKDLFIDMYGNLAMVNYPYPANFLAPLPAWPVKKLCSHLSGTVYDDEELMKHIYEGLSVYFNYTGKCKCLDINKPVSNSLGYSGWMYQWCTEMTSPICSDGVRDMFPVSRWNETESSEDCYRQWGVRPRADWSRLQYNGRHLKAFSNIIFSNGDLDPWSVLGVLETVSDSVQAIVIKNGAHHLDLRSANKMDPMSVIAAREKEKNFIQKWINE